MEQAVINFLIIFVAPMVGIGIALIITGEF